VEAGSGDEEGEVGEVEPAGVLIDARGVLRLFRRLGGKKPSVRRGSRTISTGLSVGDESRRIYDTCCQGRSESESSVVGAVEVEGWPSNVMVVVVVGVTGVVGLEGPQVEPLEPSIGGESLICGDVSRFTAELVEEGTGRPLMAQASTGRKTVLRV
jgi:hypothetical protein